MKKLTTEEFVRKAVAIHGLVYDYSKVTYINSHLKVRILCKKHGEFEQTPNNHLNGKGCEKCKVEKAKDTKLKRYGNANFNNISKIKRTNLDKYSTECSLANRDIKEIAKRTKLERYGNENYNNIEKIKTTNLDRYGTDNISKSTITKDKIRSKTLLRYSNYRDNINDILKDILDDKYTIIEYNSFLDVTIKNNETNDVINTSMYTIYRRYSNNIELTKLLKTVSILETQLYDFIKANYDGIIITNDRTILDGRELDIYLPELQLAIEFNGLYWHSEIHKDNEYHLSKTEECASKQIKLIHVYEDDWVYKQDIVKSRILNLLNKNSIRIFARKCIIKNVNAVETSKFLESNHIQGNIISKYSYGLYYNDELVSLMTFGKARFGHSGSIELLRFCNKLNTSVIGGANKLFKYALKNINFSEIISYADRSWSNGEIYYTLGFDYIGKTVPNYSYIIGNVRVNRFKYRKSNLVKMGYDINLTEKEIMFNLKFYRIYNSGNLKFVYRIW